MTAVLSHYRGIVAILILTLVALTGLGLGPPVQTLAVLAVIALVPGTALLPWLPASSTLQRAVFVVAASVALTAVLSEALAIAGRWTADGLVLALAAVGIVGVLCRRWAPELQSRR
jgi:hypothetical protein